MKTFDLDPDQLLWAAFVSGDKSAFTDLYKQHADNLFQYGLKLTSDVDLVKDNIQELFIELWNTRHKKGNVTYIKTYLLKALRYKLLKSLPKSNFQSLDEFSLGMIEQSIEAHIILKEINNQKVYELRSSISQLPQRHQEIIHLKYYQGLSTEQISELLSIKKQSVSNLLLRAISNLRVKFQKKVAVK